MPAYNKVKKMEVRVAAKGSERKRQLLEIRESESDEDEKLDVEEEQVHEPAVSDEGAGVGEPEAPAGVEVSFTEPAAWVDRMSITATKPLPPGLAPDDDPKREEVFLQHGLLSVLRGLQLLEAADVPWQRPSDYYAEMYKSETHMDKIREKILESKTRVQERAQRRAMKDQKKFGKEVQAEVLRQRSKYKKNLMEKLEDWRKKRKGGERESLDEVLDRIKEENDERGIPGGRKGRRDHFLQKKKNLIPGGARKSGNRPGKNRRRR